MKNFLIEKKYGRIFFNDDLYEITLSCKKYSNTSEFCDHVTLKAVCVLGTNLKKSLPPITIPYSGERFTIMISDFTGDGFDDVLVAGNYSGTKEFKIVALYSCIDGRFKRVFDHNYFETGIENSVKYLDDYTLVLHNQNLKKDFFIRLDSKPKDQLSLIYDATSRYNGRYHPTVSGVVGISAEKNNKNYYNMTLRQNILGANFNEPLAVLHTTIQTSLGKLKIVAQKMTTTIESHNSINTCAMPLS